jgi:D-glycero-D-manno-heptose 1,7-bisphosphate phosphatase
LSNKAFFLDRDGVINHSVFINNKPYAPRNIKEFKIIDKVEEVLNILKKRGFLNIIITNQPDVEIGSIKKEIVLEMHNIIYKKLNIDDIFTCYHTDLNNCFCRKPKPGMIHSAKKKWNIDLSKSFLVGDRWGDIELANNLNIKNFFIDYNYSEQKPENFNYKIKHLIDVLKYL